MQTASFDALALEIYVFDNNVEGGSLGNQCIFASLGESDGLPDGPTLDADVVSGQPLERVLLRRLLSNGQIGRESPLPTRKISCLYGGEQYGEIYITTAGDITKQADRALAGTLFGLKRKAGGLLDSFARIRAPSVAAMDSATASAEKTRSSRRTNESDRS